MSQQQFGMIGLGVMGQNFVLNVERNGFSVSVYNRSPEVTKAYVAGAAAGKKIKPAYSIQEFVSSLQRPRRIMLLVKAGAPVDATIQQLLPFLEKDDLIIDGGNSCFADKIGRASCRERV